MASNIIYHYCSAESFYKIIRTKEIWLSNVRFMNDLREGKYVRDVIRKAAESGAESVNFTKNHKRVYGQAYVACFSEHEDLFSQWERYANACRGFAIGFFKVQLETLLDMLSPSGPDTLDRCEGINLVKIKYADKESLYQKLKEDCPSMFKLVAEDRLTMDGFINEDFAKTLWAYKNPFFCQEDEHRIIYLPSKGWVSNPEVLGSKAYHSIGAGIRDCYPLKFASVNGIVARVVLGPLTATKKMIVQDYLKDAGLLDVEVRYSDGRGVIK